MFRKAIVLAVVLAFALPFAHADDASKRLKIREMFALLKLDSLMKQVMDQSLAQGERTAKSMFGDQPMSDADTKLQKDAIDKIYAAIRDTLSWQKLEPAYVDLYASAYSEEEIDGIVSFYKSPVGQALLAKTPELLTKSQELVSARVDSELGPRMREIMEDMQKQYKAAHPDPKPQN